MLFPTFNEEIDYCSLSLNSEIALQRTTHEHTEENILEGYEVQKEIYTRLGYTNEHWYRWWCGIMAQSYRLQKSKQEIAKFTNMNTQDERPYANTWFVTIGTNPLVQQNLKLVISVIDNLMQSDWFKNATWVYEYHTERGEHLHIMAKIEIIKNDPKSKIIQNLCKTKGLYKIVEMNQGRCSTHVSVIPYRIHHEDYIDLRKSDTKKEYLEKDVQWRKDNNLKTKYTTIV